jgi:ketosteroid isomerase-like protein
MTVVLVAGLAAASAGQQQASLPPALAAMADTERAFAKRATDVGWKQAFLEYFADDAIGFAGTEAVRARDQLRQAPDPPRDLQLLWEPRYGDVAASGELGWLTGPSTTINPARNNGAPRYGNYASIWKRQPDGRYRVLIDVGVNLPAEATFAPGFTRAPAADRYEGNDTAAAATDALRAADARLNTMAHRSQAAAFGEALAEGARLHRNAVAPLTTPGAVRQWLTPQPPWTAGETKGAETAASRDLGYTYGTYETGEHATARPEKGFYARVWVRQRDGAWKLALDVLQPQ